MAHYCVAFEATVSTSRWVLWLLAACLACSGPALGLLWACSGPALGLLISRPDKHATQSVLRSRHAKAFWYGRHTAEYLPACAG